MIRVSKDELAANGSAPDSAVEFQFTAATERALLIQAVRLCRAIPGSPVTNL